MVAAGDKRTGDGRQASTYRIRLNRGLVPARGNGFLLQTVRGPTTVIFSGCHGLSLGGGLKLSPFSSTGDGNECSFLSIPPRAFVYLME